MNCGQSIKGKVMIADDHDDSRIMLAVLLESEGWQITEASNGKEALEKILQEQPHVLVLDNRMPELTGTQLYQILREQGISTPVVLITAFGDLNELAASLGIRYYLPKPIDFERVVAAIESAYADSQKLITME